MSPSQPTRLKRPRYKMPTFIRQALVKGKLMEAYRSRPAYQQNDYIGWITRAKRKETQEKRLAQMIEELKRGDRYMNMVYKPKRKRGKSKTRKDEAFCKSKFDTFISQFSTTSNHKWRKGPENRPPDFYLFLNDLSYAVEVTRLLDEAEHALSAWLDELANEMKRTAEQKGYLSGLYKITFARRIEWNKLHAAKDALRTGLLKYIEDTRNLHNAPKKKSFNSTKVSFVP